MVTVWLPFMDILLFSISGTPIVPIVLRPLWYSFIVPYMVRLLFFPSLCHSLVPFSDSLLFSYSHCSIFEHSIVYNDLLFTFPGTSFVLYCSPLLIDHCAPPWDRLAQPRSLCIYTPSLSGLVPHSRYTICISLFLHSLRTEGLVRANSFCGSSDTIIQNG